MPRFVIWLSLALPSFTLGKFINTPPPGSRPGQGSGGWPADRPVPTNIAATFSDDPPDSPPLLCNETYNTIEDLSATQIPPECNLQYTVATLSTMLQTALANYNTLIDHDYDNKFNTYAKSIVQNSPEAVHDFVYAHGDKYFSCEVTETGKCCSECKGLDPNISPGCKYCFDGACNKDKCYIEPHCNKIRREAPGGGIGGSSGGPVLKQSNHSEPCPPDFSQRDFNGGPDHIQSVYWTFTDEDLFWGDLFNGTAMSKSETKIGSYDRGVDCNPKAASDDPCWGEGMDFGIPIVDGYSKANVTNPKDIFTAALKHTTDLNSQLEDALLAIQTDTYYGDQSELIDAVSMPVFMIVGAVENMQAIETTADTIDAEKRKAIILGVIGAILFFIPIVGEVAGSVAGAADIAAIITILGVAGDIAFNVYTIVDDPSNAPLAIFGLILVPLALSNIAKIAKAAQIRRGMSAADLAKLGPKLSDRMVWSMN